MKKLFFAAAIIFGCLSFKAADAQVRVNLGLNIGSQPEWGPVGYDHADYYYFPDVDAYYDVNNHQYIYPENNVWVHADYLPAKFRRHFDLYGSHKVVVNEAEPWRHADVYRTKYSRYKGMHDQVVIRDSHDERYRQHYVEKKTYDGRRGYAGDKHDRY